jgi:hypothetical protein
VDEARKAITFVVSRTLGNSRATIRTGKLRADWKRF